MIYVIDASVAVKWLIKEQYRIEAKKYLHSAIKRCAPDLILIEGTNTIRRKLLLNEMTQQEGDQAFDLIKEWRKGLIQLVPASDFIERGYELSKKLHFHPIPDCLYLAVAEKENAQLVTADKKFYERILRSSLSQHIAWIETPPVLSS